MVPGSNDNPQVTRLVERLNSGRWAPAVGVDRAILLPGPGIRIQVGVRLFPKKAAIYDAVEQAINLAADLNLFTVGLERGTAQTFTLSLEDRVA